MFWRGTICTGHVQSDSAPLWCKAGRGRIPVHSVSSLCEPGFAPSPNSCSEEFPKSQLQKWERLGSETSSSLAGLAQVLQHCWARFTALATCLPAPGTTSPGFRLSPLGTLISRSINNADGRGKLLESGLQREGSGACSERASCQCFVKF